MTSAPLDILRLLVEVPFCAFRPFASREYQDTYPVPTPASVYGMLLSFLGIGMTADEKFRHKGVRMALAVEELPERSNVFRKLRRGKALHDIRPDYQDLLTELRLWVWLSPGNDAALIPLPAALSSALAEPAIIEHRHGGLSLGESSYLVDRIRAAVRPPATAKFLRPGADGFHSLPIWIDHRANRCNFGRFDLVEREIDEVNLPWIVIAPD